MQPITYPFSLLAVAAGKSWQGLFYAIFVVDSVTCDLQFFETLKKYWKLYETVNWDL